jgi:hypothetical protein
MPVAKLAAGVSDNGVFSRGREVVEPARRRGARVLRGRSRDVIVLSVEHRWKGDGR